MIYSFFFALLSFPLFASFYYSYDKNILWLLGALTFLFMTSFAILSISARFKKRWNALALLPLLLIFLFEIIQLTSFYFQGEGFNDRFFFHFTLNSIQEAGAGYPLLIFGTIFMLLSFIVAVYLCSINRTFKSVPIYLSFIALLISPFLDSALKDFADQRFFSYYRYGTSEFDVAKLPMLALNKKAIVPNQLEASPGKNLVLIYLESLERIYLDESVFKALTPTINKLLKKGLSFTNISQTEGTEWTIAGIVASQCGTPLLYDNTITDGNDIIQNGFLNEATCLSDVLHKAGYVQTYLGGASSQFAGKGEFLKAHHYDNVKGYDALISRATNKTYKTGWGLYDDSLFEMAVEEYVRLANMKKPFNLTLLTIDTHHPHGNPSRSCKAYAHQKNRMLDAVHCTDQLLTRFIDRVSRHPAAKNAIKNTIAVLVSDHLAMRNDAENFYPKKYERKLLFSILNSDMKGVNKTPGTHMDIAPTILDTIGVKHNAEFLAGKNLFEFEKADQREHPDFFDAETTQAIRYINSHFFSQGNYSLCEGKYLAINESQASIKIGNKRVFLSINGWQVPKDRFQKDLAIIAFIDDKGAIKKSSVISLTLLPHILYANTDDIFFLITPVTPNKKLPYGLNDLTKSANGTVSVLLGKLGGLIMHLGSFADLRLLQIERENCEDLVKAVQKSAQNIAEELCPSDNQYAASYTKESKLITIPRIISLDGMFKATLIPETPRRFTVKTYSQLDSADLSQWDYCYTYHTVEDTLYIPSILIDNTKHSLEMKIISYGPITFEINEEDAFLFE
jgi:phosphoglycerol transferase MdoB-like AlkP superfamily enzyme